MPAEPLSTGVVLAVVGVLMVLSVLSSRAAGRIGVPVALAFIAIGILAGAPQVGGIRFASYSQTFRLGTVALVLILFDGGLNTSLTAARTAAKPATVLATFGVIGAALVMAAGAHGLGRSWSESLLLGAIVSSTDAAAVFSVLRGSGIHLKKRVGLTLELESGLNDPMAVLLTMAFTESAVKGEAPGPHLIVDLLYELGAGAGLGVAFGYAARFLLKRVRLPAAGLYPVLTVAIAFLSFGVTTLLGASGFLATYLTAMLVGNEAVRYRTGVLRVHDGIAWLAQVGMFLILGLLADTERLIHVAPQGLALGLMLAFLARPLTVLLCLAPFRYPLREALYIGWVGLRGAVPVILATFPVLADAPGARTVFDLVFFIVVVNALIPGATVKWVTNALKLTANAPPPPETVLEIASTQVLNGEIAAFYVDSASAVCGATIADLPFPAGAVATLIVRGKELVPPKGSTKLEAGDHVYVFCHDTDMGLVRLLFGQSESD